MEDYVLPNYIEDNIFEKYLTLVHTITGVCNMTYNTKSALMFIQKHYIIRNSCETMIRRGKAEGATRVIYENIDGLNNQIGRNRKFGKGEGDNR